MGVTAAGEMVDYACELCVPRRISQEVLVAAKEPGNPNSQNMYKTLYFTSELYAIGLFHLFEVFRFVCMLAGVDFSCYCFFIPKTNSPTHPSAQQVISCMCKIWIRARRTCSASSVYAREPFWVAVK
jgi:hypothetical protein